MAASVTAPHDSYSTMDDLRVSTSPAELSVRENFVPETMQTGALIVNADDWGRDREVTSHIFECLRSGTVSSSSGMVFMEDSERAANVARENLFDIGLHLNFTTPFSQRGCSERLRRHQERITRFLSVSHLAQIFYNPLLSNSFRYVVATQLDEFEKLYGNRPRRVDGHHHMHLCANVLLAGLLPDGILVRRSFSFQPGEKSTFNRLYRKGVDSLLARKHVLTDFFHSLAPIEPLDRIRHIGRMARAHVVELECHPVLPAEFQLLVSRERFLELIGVVPARGYKWATMRCVSEVL